MAKDAKGHGSEKRGGSVAAHQTGVAVATISGRKLEPGMANAILHDTNSHDRDFHTLRSDQVLRLADYAKQFGYRKSASSSGSTARAFHAHLSNRRAREIRAHNAGLHEYYGTRKPRG